LQTETEQFNKAIKGVKSRARALMQQGMSAKAAQQMAQKAVTGERLRSVFVCLSGEARGAASGADAAGHVSSGWSAIGTGDRHR
jgi:hypothetical protein